MINVKLNITMDVDVESSDGVRIPLLAFAKADLPWMEDGVPCEIKDHTGEAIGTATVEINPAEDK